MTPRIQIGTREGLWELDGDRVSSVEAFAGKGLTALAADGAREWAIVDGRTLWARAGSSWTLRATIEGHAATCLAAAPGALWIGTEEAHLLRLADDGRHRERRPPGAGAPFARRGRAGRGGRRLRREPRLRRVVAIHHGRDARPLSARGGGERRHGTRLGVVWSGRPPRRALSRAPRRGLRVRALHR